MNPTRLLRAVATVAGSAGLVVAATAPAAEAAPFCREVKVGLRSVAIVCVVNNTTTGTATVTPYVAVGCSLLDDSAQCAIEPVQAGTTGFTPSPTPPTVNVDVATLTVSSGGGNVGTLWIDGKGLPVSIPPFCVGDPAIC